eukprot:1157809-Pelagomonas_calceolata.AAC.14
MGCACCCTNTADLENSPMPPPLSITEMTEGGADDAYTPPPKQEGGRGAVWDPSHDVHPVSEDQESSPPEYRTPLCVPVPWGPKHFDPQVGRDTCCLSHQVPLKALLFAPEGIDLFMWCAWMDYIAEERGLGGVRKRPFGRHTQFKRKKLNALNPKQGQSIGKHVGPTGEGRLWWGVCVHDSESEPHAHGCGPRGGGIQTCSKPIQTSRIVTSYNVLLLGEVWRAVCGLASQLWVSGGQMDGEFKPTSYLIIWIRALEGDFRPREWFLPEGSWLLEAFQLEDTYFGGGQTQIDIYTKEPPAGSSYFDLQDELAAIPGTLVASEYMAEVPPFISWYRLFLEYVQKVKPAADLVNGRPGSQNDFMAWLIEWLSTPQGAAFEGNVVFNPDRTDLLSSKVRKDAELHLVHGADADGYVTQPWIIRIEEGSADRDPEPEPTSKQCPLPVMLIIVLITATALSTVPHVAHLQMTGYSKEYVVSAPFCASCAMEIPGRCDASWAVKLTEDVRMLAEKAAPNLNGMAFSRVSASTGGHTHSTTEWCKVCNGSFGASMV